MGHSRKSLGLRGGMWVTCAEDSCKSSDLRGCFGGLDGWVDRRGGVRFECSTLLEC